MIPKKFIKQLLKDCQELKNIGVIESFEIRDGNVKFRLSELGIKLAPFSEEGREALLNSFFAEYNG
jgi:hypothetical protein